MKILAATGKKAKPAELCDDAASEGKDVNGKGLGATRPMKVLLLVVLVLVLCAVLFFSGIVSPRRSRRMQDRVERAAGKAEKRSRKRGGSLGKTAGDAIENSRKAAQASGEKGRELNDRLDKR